MPQAWNDAQAEAIRLQTSLAATSDQREAAKLEGDGGRAAGGNAAGLRREGEGEGGLVYELLAVVVHRGSAYSGHYHALIRDFLQEVRRDNDGFVGVEDEGCWVVRAMYVVTIA